MSPKLYVVKPIRTTEAMSLVDRRVYTFPARLSSSTYEPFAGQPIHLTDAQRDDLKEIARSNALHARMVQRTKIVLVLADGVSGRAVETKLEVSRPTIAKWRRRFLDHGVEGLTNRHGGRAPWKLTARVRAPVLAPARRPPRDGTTQWSSRRLADHLGVRKKIVQRIWREADLRIGWPATWRPTTPTSRRRPPTSSGSTWTRHAIPRCSASMRRPPFGLSTAGSACCRSRRAGSSVTDSSTSGTVRCRSTRR